MECRHTVHQMYAESNVTSVCHGLGICTLTKSRLRHTHSDWSVCIHLMHSIPTFNTLSLYTATTGVKCKSTCINTIYLVDFWSKNLNLPGRVNKTSKCTSVMMKRHFETFNQATSLCLPKGDIPHST